MPKRKTGDYHAHVFNRGGHLYRFEESLTRTARTAIHRVHDY
jgi:hypothetical protein